MPIDVSNLVQTAKSIQTYDPKFFSTKLTGSGKNQGVLTQSQNPGNIQVAPNMSPQHLSPRKRHYTNGGTNIYELPFSVITEEMWPHMTVYMPDDKTLTSRVCIGNITNNPATTTNCDIHLDMLAFSIIMDETKNKSGVGYNRRITPCYQIFVYFECDKTKKGYRYVSANSLFNNPIHHIRNAENLYTVLYTTKPKQDFESIRSDIEHVGGYIDVVMMMDYMADFSLYDSICRQSEIWQTSCDKIIEQLLTNISHTQDTNTLNDTASMFIALEQYPIPLDLYRPIYQAISKNFMPDTALILCKQNLNLLLNDTLFSLSNKKTKLFTIPNPTQPVPTKIPLSKAQLSAVTTNDPLVLVQSGAGSGKALPLDTPILTPTGWTKMGDLKIGDKVIGSDGKPCHVLRIHEQGLKPGYKLTFRDHSSVIACGEHLWTLYRNDKIYSRAITTEDWLHAPDKNELYVPYMSPIETYNGKNIDERTKCIQTCFNGKDTASFNNKEAARTTLEYLWSMSIPAEMAGEDNNYTVTKLPDETKRTLINAEPIEPVPMRCIEVDAEDKLYVTKDFIVTHNSTVILNRLAYMVNSGVKPEDITVISFTNAAADHIKEEQSLVHSMTACAMINAIYMANFPTHALNTMESMASTIKAVYANPTTDPKHNLAHRFADHITNMDNTRGSSQESNPQTRLNNFIEHHLNDILNILNELGQTTLELQIIICYQMIGKLVEPPEIQTKYLIIDEVQDNSVFEFIYFLRYAEKHNASLFLVGDCSQTLYEFRASNPKALNTLEASGIFETHQLDINYRSNQEILDFANITLSRIEANQYANIQLKANSLATVTEKSFTEKVQLEAYQCAKKGNQFNKMLPEIIKGDLKAYLDDKLQKKEQVAFMAYPRVQVSIIEATLREMYPSANIVSIMSEKQKSTTLFTRFITGYWNEVHWAPTPDLDTIIANLITAKLPYLIRRMNDAAQKAALNQVSKWRMDNAAKIKSWSRQYQNGVITQTKLLENTMQNMIDFEVRTNAIAQLLASQRNNDRKNEQDIKSADFVMSTIHSAKGREFPHCVIIYKDSAELSEPDKRAYYVALTRAMQSEFIIAYDTYDNPDIKGQYEMILNTLQQNQTAGSKP